MIAFPNCKINLGLNITAKRQDGFHDLETVFIPVPFQDILEIIPASTFTFSVSGLAVNTNDNLCTKAYDLVKKDFPNLPAVKMHLHKTIPMGAGLGGGSSDAAFVLQMLNEKFNLHLSEERLKGYALHLGSDCPFFLINTPCFATGRGEILQPVNIDLRGYQLLIINPGIHISTQWAFSQVTPQMPSRSIVDIIAQPISTWKARLKNDFEDPVFSSYPDIKKLKEQLYQAGALYAAMSGSGSSVFGIFPPGHLIDIDKNETYRYHSAAFGK